MIAGVSSIVLNNDVVVDMVIVVVFAIVVAIVFATVVDIASVSVSGCGIAGAIVSLSVIIMR